MFKIEMFRKRLEEKYGVKPNCSKLSEFTGDMWLYYDYNDEVAAQVNDVLDGMDITWDDKWGKGPYVWTLAVAYLDGDRLAVYETITNRY